MPRPSACRISDAAAICTATEMRCMTKGTYLRVAHVASRSNSLCACVSQPRRRRGIYLHAYTREGRKESTLLK